MREVALEFCFESMNWSPYFGREGMRAADLIEAARRAEFALISFDHDLLQAEAEAGTSLRDVAACVEDAGLRVLSIHSLAITAESEADLERAKPLLEAAAALGAPYLASGVSSEVDGAVLENAARLGELAQAAGAALAIEFLPFLPVSSIGATRSVIARCLPDTAKMVVDAWHFFFGPDDWQTLASLGAEEIAYVQFDDHPALVSSDLLEETTQRRVLPGEGEFDLERFARVISETGFDGPVGFELLSRDARREDPMRVACRLMDAGRGYWGQAGRRT